MPTSYWFVSYVLNDQVQIINGGGVGGGCCVHKISDWLYWTSIKCQTLQWGQQLTVVIVLRVTFDLPTLPINVLGTMVLLHYWGTPGWPPDPTFRAWWWWNLRSSGLCALLCSGPHFTLLSHWAAHRAQDLFLEHHGVCSFHLEEGGLSWAQHEPASLTLWAGTSRQQPAGHPPSSSRTGKHAIITPFILQIVSQEVVSHVEEAAAVKCISAARD